MACFCSCLLAALTCAGAEPKYTPKPEDFRILDGKLYNAVLSMAWTRLPKHSGSLKVYEIIPQGVIVQPILPAIDGAKYLIKNHPEQKTLTTGKWIGAMDVFRRGVFTYGLDTMEVYDWGLPNTPENRKTLTNSVAAPKP